LDKIEREKEDADEIKMDLQEQKNNGVSQIYQRD